jgi:uncharacterized membrane protein
MASKLVVLAFDGPDTAATMMHNIRDLQAKGAIKLEDAVIASRGNSTQILMGTADNFPGYMQTPGTQDLKVQQTASHRGRTATAGASIGLLAGMILGGPVGGLAVGALIGAMRDRGIKDSFIEELGKQIKPNSSALFLLVAEADADKVLSELRPFKASVLYTDLPAETEQKLREELAKGQ